MTTATVADPVELTAARRLISAGIGRKLREREGLSLRELAASCGTSPQTLSRWETGQVVSPRPAAALAYGRWLRHVLGDER